MVSSEDGGISSWPGAVQYFLRNYARSSRINSAIADLREVSQGPMKAERELATKLNQATCSCNDAYPPKLVLNLYMDDLHPTIRSVIVCYKTFRHQATYLDTLDFGQHERDTVRTHTSAPQTGHIGKPVEKLQPAALVESLTNNKTASTGCPKKNSI